MTQVSVQCEKSSTVLTFYFWPERVGIHDQHGNALSITRADFDKIVEASKR
jgi:hypothetical protein